ncbi:unnamed protein product [Closterium sp. NIES-65]|nr:unnamed protein product [Closterium sp. NIES-65]
MVAEVGLTVAEAGPALAEEEGRILAQAASGMEAARLSGGKSGEIPGRISDLEIVSDLGGGDLSVAGKSHEADALLRILTRASLGEDDAVESGTEEQDCLLQKHSPCSEALEPPFRAEGTSSGATAALPSDGLRDSNEKQQQQQQQQHEPVRDDREKQPPLIPGLSDDVARLCLARLPRRSHRCARAVCRSWASLLRSQEFFTLRRAIGRHEQWLVVLAGGRGNRPFRLEAFDPSLLPPPSVPSLVSLHPIRSHFLWGCQLATVGRGRFVLVIGGAVGTDAYHTQNAVWRYDGVTGRWSSAAPMLDARSNFACGTFGRFVVVAGGWDAKREPLRSAEVYDSEKDTWHRLIGLNRRRGQCLGTVFEGKFLVLSGVDRIANNGTTITTTLGCCEAMSLSEDGLERLVRGKERREEEDMVREREESSLTEIGREREGERKGEGEEEREEKVREREGEGAGGRGSTRSWAADGESCVTVGTGEAVRGELGDNGERGGRLGQHDEEQEGGHEEGSACGVASVGRVLGSSSSTTRDSRTGSCEEQTKQEQPEEQEGREGKEGKKERKGEEEEEQLQEQQQQEQQQQEQQQQEEEERHALGSDGSLSWSIMEAAWLLVSLPGSLAVVENRLFAVADIGSSLREFDPETTTWWDVLQVPYPQKGFRLLALNQGLLLLGVYGGHWLIPQKLPLGQGLSAAARADGAAPQKAVHWDGLSLLHTDALAWAILTL